MFEKTSKKVLSEKMLLLLGHLNSDIYFLLQKAQKSNIKAAHTTFDEDFNLCWCLFFFFFLLF